MVCRKLECVSCACYGARVGNVKYLVAGRDAGAKWSLTILAAVWKVHNDQHQITVSPSVDKYLVYLKMPKVQVLSF